MDEMMTKAGGPWGASFAGGMGEALGVLWKRRIFLAIVTVAGTLAIAFFALLQDDVYQTSVVIAPVAAKDSASQGLSSMAMQFGSLGMVLPGSPSSSEIVNLLRSRVVKEKAIKKYNLLPMLFRDRWDEDRKEWKGKESQGAFAVSGAADGVMAIVRAKAGEKQALKNAGKGPTVWDGIRKLNTVISINNMVKDNVIIVSVDFHDPQGAARIAEYLLETLTEHMTGEARRVAMQNKSYLEEQLGVVADPFIRQKVYTLMAQQIETAMMSEVKENFAFKVIDPPKVPDRKIRPKRRQMAVIGFIASFFSAVLMAYSHEYFKKSHSQAPEKEIQTEED